MSRMLLAPAQTTATGVRASSVRSAEMSQGWVSRWAPPMPPVANRRMPARWARHMVAATVVAAVRFWTMAKARSRRLALRTFSCWARTRISSTFRPDGRPAFPDADGRRHRPFRWTTASAAWPFAG